MNRTNRKMHLNLTLHSIGFHDAAWRHPHTDVNTLFDVKHYMQLARKAEAAKMDSLFLADSLYVQREGLKFGAFQGLEPFTLLSAIAAVTERIGLIGTLSTSFSDPFNAARILASLDHISGGRAGWNIVTTGADAAAQNFGLDRISDHGDRYKRGQEFVQVALKLWDSWEEGALLLDKQAGRFADIDKVHEIDHEGAYYRVKGPLNVPRTPQGRIFLVQAGASKDGRDLAARYAEAIYTAQQDFGEARSFYADMKSRIARYERNANNVNILPGVCTIIGSTEEEAKRNAEELQELSSPEYALLQLTNHIGIDLSGFPLDASFPELPAPQEIRAYQSRAELIANMAKRDNLTLRQVLARLTTGRGHGTVIGTPEQIADHLEHWFLHGAADGFNIMPQVIAGGLEAFTDFVIPELRRRRLFREEYESDTLRGHYLNEA